MLSILTYHSLDESGSVVSISPRIFAEQMAMLEAAGFRGISLNEALVYRKANGNWPDRSVAITFDDGFANFYEAAAPALARHNFTATVFVVTAHVGGQNDWAQPPAGLGLQRMMEWSQISELAEQGIEIGAHTRTHPDLRRLSAQELEIEIAGSCSDISDKTGQPVNTFAYPFGYLNDLAQKVVQQKVGAGCTTELKRASAQPFHSLPRIDMYYLQSPGKLRELVIGKLDGYLTIRRWGRSIKSAGILPGIRLADD